MFKKLVYIFILAFSITINASPVTDNQYLASDSMLYLNEVSVTAIKQGFNLQNEPISSTTIGRKKIGRASCRERVYFLV